MSAPAAREMARRIRRDVIEMAFRSRGPHVGSALSCADILAVLYGGVLRLSPWGERDLFVMSKGHAAMALYAALADRGIIPRESLATYFADGGALPAHLDRGTAPGVECSTGALGHGFSMALGMALGLARGGSSRRVFVLLGDGESQEGSVWEGAMFAPRLGLANVTAVVDKNGLQGYGRPCEVCSFEPLAEKWEAFGWEAAAVDGHDHAALEEVLSRPPGPRPRVVIASTVKGKGVSFMEDQLVWHYYVVTAEHRERALRELS